VKKPAPKSKKLTERLKAAVDKSVPVSVEAAMGVSRTVSLAARLAATNQLPEQEEPVVKAGRKPTEEQKAILAAVREALNGGHPVLMVEAGAGTGKTTTLRMIADVANGNGQYTAFNSSLVAESKAKFQGTRVACNTTHSLAFRAEGKRFAHRLSGGRVRSDYIAKALGIQELKVFVGSGDERKEKPLSPGFLASQVMGAIRRFCQSADQAPKAEHFKYLDGIDLPSESGGRGYYNNELVRDYLVPFAGKAWADLSNPEGSLPFGHDHYVKVWQLSNPIIAGDYILLDEAQDTAPVMLDILRQQKAPIILVGDSAQQIYEWRGAVNALAAFPDAPRRLLSQSFRFGPAIAVIANAVLDTLDEATPLRLKGLPSIDSRVQPVANPVAILCRTNAMAVAKLLGAIAGGKRPFLVGGGSDVISFVEAAQSLQQGKSTGHPDLALFGNWVEVQEYSKLDEGEDLRLMVKLIDEFTCDAILGALKAMPAEKDADLVISTAHKSKGREWDSVQLAADFPTKSKCSDSDRKLLYVSVTRAKLELDVSQCPFFTGNDSLDVSGAIAACPKPEAKSILSPAPAGPVAGGGGKRGDEMNFSWAKYDGAWVVRGPYDSVGKTVDVYRKDGSKQSKKLLAVVREFPEATLYKV